MVPLAVGWSNNFNCNPLILRLSAFRVKIAFEVFLRSLTTPIFVYRITPTADNSRDVHGPLHGLFNVVSLFRGQSDIASRVAFCSAGLAVVGFLEVIGRMRVG